MKQAAAEELHGLLYTLEGEVAHQDFFCGGLSLADLAAICYVPAAKLMGVQLDEFAGCGLGLIGSSHTGRRSRSRAGQQGLSELRSIADEFEGPDGRVHWRDSRLEWPIRHGFIDLVAREFHAGKMMFPLPEHPSNATS
jgi:hypothetical protein